MVKARDEGGKKKEEKYNWNDNEESKDIEKSGAEFEDSDNKGKKERKKEKGNKVEDESGDIDDMLTVF